MGGIKLAGRHRETFWQLVRYGVNGGLVTVFYAFVYWVVVRYGGIRPQIANLTAFVVAVAISYTLHSQVTFRGHGERDRSTQLRYAVASLLGYAVNAFWVWLLTAHLHLDVRTPLLCFVFVTPILLFAVNRWWVFR